MGYNFNVERYKLLQKVRALLSAEKNAWREFLSIEAIGHITSEGRYSMRADKYILDQLDAFQKEIGHLMAGRDLWMATGKLEETADTIRKLRRMARSVEGYAPIAKYKREAQTYSTHALNRAFPTIGTASHVYGSGSLDVDGPHSIYETSRLHVNVPVSWFKNVGRLGLGLIKAGQGYRFIMNASEETVPWVAEEGFRAYRVHAVKVRGKKASAEDAWVVVTDHTNSTWETPLVDLTSRKVAIPHGYNTSLRKAVALVRNRTFNRLEEMLDAI